MGVAPPSTAVRIEEVGDRLLVRIPPHRSWMVAYVGCFWILWTLGGISLFADVADVADGAGFEDLHRLVTLCVWVLGECACIAFVAWHLFGCVLLTVTPQHIEVRKELGRLSRTRRYDTALVQGVRGERVPSDDESPPRSDFCVELWHRDKPVYVGEGLGEQEADYLASRVWQWIRPRGSWGEEQGAPWRGETPQRPRSLAATLLRSVAFPVAVVGALAWIYFDRDEPKAIAPRAVPSESREFAAAKTSFILSRGGGEVLGRPQCLARVTWKAWSCTVPARAAAGPYAGLELTYRCTYELQGDGSSRTLCGPQDPPPIPGVVVSPAS